MEVTAEMIYVDNHVHESDMHVDNLENVFQASFPENNQNVLESNSVIQGNIHDSRKENNEENSVGFDTAALDIGTNGNDFLLDENIVDSVDKDNILHGNLENESVTVDMISISCDTLESVEHICV